MSQSAMSTSAEDVDRNLLEAVELPDPVPEALALERVGAEQLCSEPPAHDVVEDDAAEQCPYPTMPSSVPRTSQPSTRSGSDPGRPSRHRKGGVDRGLLAQNDIDRGDLHVLAAP